MAVNRIEVDAGSCRDVCLFQHLLGKFEAVGGEFRNVGVEVKRAVGGQEFVDPGLRQACNQDAAILLVAALDFFHLEAAFERSLGGNLRQRRHRNGKILLQPFDRPHQRFRHHHPADPPAGHAEIFRERVDDERMRRKLRRRHCRKRIVEAMIDFVGDEPDTRAFRRRYQAGERLSRHHRTRGIGRAADQHAL